MRSRLLSRCRGIAIRKRCATSSASQPADLDDYALEWQARAAIWSGDWPRVANTVAAMSDTQRGLTRWRYWAARAAERTGEAQLARQLYESTLPDDNYYSVAASSRLGQPVAPHPERLVIDEVQLKEIEQLPALVRARELFRCEMREPANQEWANGYEMLPQALARRPCISLRAGAGTTGDHGGRAATLVQRLRPAVPAAFDRQVRAAAAAEQVAAAS